MPYGRSFYFWVLVKEIMLAISYFMMVRRKKEPRQGGLPLGLETVKKSGHKDPDLEPVQEPVLNIPSLVAGLIALLALIHAIRIYGPNLWYYWTTAYLSFLPVRFNVPLGEAGPLWSLWLTPVSHAFLHASWLHLAINCFWLLAFSTPFLRRLGSMRFFILYFGASSTGAFAYYIMNDPLSAIPMVGASGAVSGFMGAAARFALCNMNPGQNDSHLGARLSVLQTFTDRKTITFIIVFFGVNAIAATGLMTPDGSAGIAWEAHLGGFFFGLLSFGLLDFEVGRNDFSL